MVEHRLTSEGEAGADAGEDEADFSAGDHGDADGEPVEPAVENAQGAELFADDGRDRERDGQADRAFDGEGGEVGAEAHGDEEDGREEARDRSDQIFEGALAPRDEVAIVDALEDEAGGEGADDGREADFARAPCQQEAEGEAEGEEDAAAAEAGSEAEDARREGDAESDGAAEEEDGLAEAQPPRITP